MLEVEGRIVPPSCILSTVRFHTKLFLYG